MKKILLTIILSLFTFAGNSQDIKSNQLTFEDFLPLLEAQGYRAYSFDTSAFQGKKMSPGLKEYVDGKEVRDAFVGTSFPISLKLTDRLTIGIMPLVNDSTSQYTIAAIGGSSLHSELPLRPIPMPDDCKFSKYQYDTRPFKISNPIKTGVFIPLVLYSSYWYDDNFKITRSCMSQLIDPDLSDDALKHIKNYYIFGMTITEE